MLQKMDKIRDELHTYRDEYGLSRKTLCVLNENKEYRQILKDEGELPDGVYPDTSEKNVDDMFFYTVTKPNLTESEIMEYLIYKKLELLRVIKRCVVFFTVLTIISLIIILFSLF